MYQPWQQPYWHTGASQQPQQSQQQQQQQQQQPQAPSHQHQQLAQGAHLHHQYYNQQYAQQQQPQQAMMQYMQPHHQPNYFHGQHQQQAYHQHQHQHQHQQQQQPYQHHHHHHLQQQQQQQHQQQKQQQKQHQKQAQKQQQPKHQHHQQQKQQQHVQTTQERKEPSEGQNGPAIAGSTGSGSRKRKRPNRRRRGRRNAHHPGGEEGDSGQADATAEKAEQNSTVDQDATTLKQGDVATAMSDAKGKTQSERKSQVESPLQSDAQPLANEERGKADSKTKREAASGRPNKRRKKQDKDVFADLHPKYLAAHRLGTSPEEIARWRAERRRNYPTQANIARKEEAAATTEKAAPAALLMEEGTPEDETLRQSRKDESAAPLQKESRQQNEVKPKHHKQRVCNRFLLSGECKVAKCRFSHDPAQRTETLIARRKRAEKQQFLRATARPGGHDSILRKLLRADIAKERAVILHCIHHVLQRAATATNASQ